MSAELETVLDRNAALQDVLDRLETVGLPNAYVAAGAVVQTVWNAVTHRPLDYGIRDYDVVYFDPDDLSEAGEAAVQARFAGLGRDCDVVNQARVHLWYEERFGVPCPPFASSEAAIDRFEATTVAVGVRRRQEGGLRVYAPYGLADVFDLVIRPNPRLAPRRVFEAKAARWQDRWPELTVLPWPA